MGIQQSSDSESGTNGVAELTRYYFWPTNMLRSKNEELKGVNGETDDWVSRLTLSSMQVSLYKFLEIRFSLFLQHQSV